MKPVKAIIAILMIILIIGIILLVGTLISINNKKSNDIKANEMLFEDIGD